VNLRTAERRPLSAFRGRATHALAAVGHPDAFFTSLAEAGLSLTAHALADHAALEPQSLPFPTGVTVLMTEKDAVKCRGFAEADWWFVELEVAIERAAAARLLTLVLERTGLTGAGVPLG
jgi:tetraacyldisaccharide 4'-kinase